jgi:hypothetical protein
LLTPAKRVIAACSFAIALEMLGAQDENGAPLVKADTAPGLPASMKTLWAARDRAASTGGASAPRP